MTENVYYTETPDNEPDTLRAFSRKFMQYLKSISVNADNIWLEHDSDKDIIESLPDDEASRGFYLVVKEGSTIHYGWSNPALVYTSSDRYNYIHVNLFTGDFIGVIL